MYIALVLFSPVPLTIMFAAILSVATGVGGFEWPISAREVIKDVN